MAPSVRWDRVQTSTGPVWGVADLHAHPAIHLAFGGLDGESGLIWGSPGDRSHWPADPPNIPACDPETHAGGRSDQVTRTARALLQSQIARTTKYPHGRNGGVSGPGDNYENWPNGRDVYHNAMHIDSIRRAYEAGLRLMFAGPTDSQPLTMILRSPVFPGEPRLSREKELESARAQLDAIVAMAEANSDWMEVVSTPDQALQAIREGRLAIVLSLEMDALRIEDIEALVDAYGVASVVPIHLVDNDVGGTAAFSDVFNAASALMGQLDGHEGRYVSVEPDPDLDFRFGYPQKLGVSRLSFEITDVDYAIAGPLGYAPHPLCDPAEGGVAGELGHRNSVGLRRPEVIRRLMQRGVLVDVAHMSLRARESVLDVAQELGCHPVIDSHTGLYDGPARGESERDLFGAHARAIHRFGGVIGAGTQGSFMRGQARGPSLQMRGGPLLVFGGPTRQTAHAAFAHAQGCGRPILDRPGDLRVTLAVRGTRSPSSLPYVRVTWAGGHFEEQRLVGGAVLTATVGRSQDWGAVAQVQVGVLEPRECIRDAGAALTLAGVKISVGGANEPPEDLPSPVTLDGTRPTYDVYRRCEDPDPPAAPSPTDPAVERHLRVRVKSGNKPLLSASALRRGMRVGILLCTGDPARCTCPAPPATSPELFELMTPGGGWPAQFELEQYLRVERDFRLSDVNGVQFCLEQRDLEGEPWEVDEVSIEEVEDPIRVWVQDYIRARGALGTGTVSIALGTDFNGLAPRFPFSNYAVPYELGGCGTSGQAASYGDSSTGGEVTLVRPERVGATNLCLDRRGLATYGMLAEVFSAIYHYDRDTYRRLFLSAQATIDAWRRARDSLRACPPGAR